MSSVVSNLTQYFVEGSTAALQYRLGNLSDYTIIAKEDKAYQNGYVRVPFISGSAQAVSTFSHTSGYPTSDSSVVGTSVQLVDWLARPYDISDTDWAHITPEVMTKLAATNINLLAKDIESKLYTAASASLTNYTQASGSAWSSTTGIIGLATSASAARYDLNEMYFVSAYDLYWKAAGNTTTLIANGLGSPDVVKNGMLTKYYGWNTVISDAIPSTVKGFGFTRDSLILGAATPTPQSPNTLLSYNVVTLPNGLPIQLISFRDEPKRKTTFVAELLCGYGVQRGGFNIRVTDMNV